MTVLHSPVDAPLSRAMREGSQAEHTEAETSSFMAELLAGRVNERGYTAYLLRLREVYAALEETGRRLAGDPAVAAVLDPALDRLAAIDADLAHWTGEASADLDSPAAAAYRARIEATSGGHSALYLAHHYTRYLGDLSGGQVIGRMLTREFGLDGAGVDFYEFPAIPKPKPYKDAYRARLDALRLSPDEKQRVVDEVRVAFRLNHALFSELGERLSDYRR
ncbi:heme oxygenase (biliverdin-producing) [Nocardioides speluncae]|uniref:biliverdin-producing heme oxygenase n=1 Tax=Nocardioides speluncae TaxID=2670337 RepID=UPI001F0C9958|nr:biliverdin-producing heme oxygenase [Nocardioides speluncae]